MNSQAHWEKVGRIMVRPGGLANARLPDFKVSTPNRYHAPMTTAIRILLMVLTALILHRTAAGGNFEDGEAAYRAGHYGAAFRHFSAAAGTGDAEAQFRLGELYRRGLGVKAGAGQAARWYRKAAAQDHVEAIVALAEMHATGSGARKDHVRAWRLFDRATKLGSVWAANRAGRIWNGLSRYQRNEALKDSTDD
jgi:TPR repeat protein